MTLRSLTMAARVTVVVLVAALVPLLSGTAALAASPANDAFAGAAVLSGPLPITVSGTTVDATEEPGEPNHAGRTSTSSVWYRWTPDTSGYVDVNTCTATFDSALAVYTGAALDALTAVVSSDNGCGQQSKVVLNAAAGQTYLVAVDSWSGSGAGLFDLTIQPTTPPANDLIANAQVIGGALPIQTTGTNVDATMELGEPLHAARAGGHSVWYRWTAEVSGLVIVNTCGSTFNTLLGVYTGDAVDGLTVVASNDNAAECGQDGGPSQVQFQATAGQTYRIAVDGSFERTGTVQLAIRTANPPPNDDLAHAQVIEGPLPMEVGGTNVHATKERGEPVHQGTAGGYSIWYRWTPATSGFVSIDTCASSFNTLLAVYIGAAVDALVPVMSGHRTASCGALDRGSSLVMHAEAGITYQIAVDGGTSGPITLRLALASPPPNDRFPDAQHLSGGLPSDVSGTNVDASKEPGEPSHAGEAGGASVWYSWTPTASSLVSIDTCASDFTTVLAVYTGEAVDALTPVASNMFSGTCYHSRVTFAASRGTTYRIAVDGRWAAVGRIGLALRSVSAPANDALAAAQDLTDPPPITVTGSSANATKEPGEPDHAGNVGGASVWYRWTPDVSGIIVIETCASGYDTLLAVYTGEAVHALTQVASNDNATSSCGTGFGSRVRLPVDAGRTYWIAVDGRGGATGAVDLRLRPLNPPGNDSFAAAEVVSGPLPIRIEGTNVDATKEPGEPDHAGRAGGASVWYRWTPDASGEVFVDACGGDPRLSAVYTGPAVDALTLVAGDSGCSGSETGRFTAVAGTTYWIAVDGLNELMGRVVLDIRVPPLNDHLANPQVLTGTLPITVTGTSANATTEPYEPNHGGGFGDTSVWYQWTADTSDPVVVDLCGSSFDTLLGVYTGTEMKLLMAVAGNDNACGTRSRAVFTPAVGETYSIAVGGRWGGSVVLTIRHPNLPPNDRFAAAHVLDGVLPITAHGTTADATAEAGEPDHAGFAPTSSVWYRWTPPVSGSAVVTLCNSNADTLLGVYTGDAVDELTPVASNDDGCGAGGPSEARFSVTAGETYSFAVDGWHGASAPFALTLRVPPPNDDFAGARAVPGGLPVRLSGSTLDASGEPSEPDHAGYSPMSSIWYSWTPTASGSVVVDTCGSGVHDTALAVYTGDGLAGLSEIASNDDADLQCGSWLSAVTVDAVVGTTYWITIETGWSPGPVGLRITPGTPQEPPANDGFQSAQALDRSLPVEVTGSNVGATTEAGEPDHTGHGAASVWFRWTAAETGPVVVETCGSTFDTTLGVYTGTAVDGLSLVANNDDACGVQSKVEYPAVAGTTYHIAVDSFGSAGGGSFTLRIRPRVLPPNDAFAEAQLLSPTLPVHVTGTTLDATREAGEPLDGRTTVWYSWIPVTSGPVMMETCGASLALYTGPTVQDLTSLGRNDWTAPGCQGGNGTLARLVVPVSAGRPYHIAADAGSAGFTLTVRDALPPANDNFPDAEVLAEKQKKDSLPIRVTGTNVDAWSETGESYVMNDHRASVWYRWTADVTGPITVETCGSSFDTLLGISTGGRVEDLSTVAVNDNSCGNQSRVTFPAVAGTTYQISVDGRDAATGSIELLLRAAGPPPNDDFAGAQALTGPLPISATGSTIDATKQWSEGESWHGLGQGHASVWYRFTPTGSGLLAVDVCESDFDTLLAIYTGDSVSSIHEVTYADDGCHLVFFATAGQTYQIAVDGDDGAAGSVDLELRAVPGNDDINRAHTLSGKLPTKSTATNEDASKEVGEPDHAGDTGGASLWYRWTPAAAGRFVIDTCGSQIPAVVGVYTGGAVNRLTEVASDAGSCGSRGRVELNAVPGQTYLIAVDGAGGATGQIRLSITPRP